MIRAVVFDVGECLVDESTEYGTTGSGCRVIRSRRCSGPSSRGGALRQLPAPHPRSAVEAAGLASLNLTAHKLRHTAASLAIASGADVKVIQTMLGHKTATMTLDTYGHLFPDRLDEVAKQMSDQRAAALRKARSATRRTRKRAG